VLKGDWRGNAVAKRSLKEVDNSDDFSVITSDAIFSGEDLEL
jgi:hypothetical protein